MDLVTGRAAAAAHREAPRAATAAVRDVAPRRAGPETVVPARLVRADSRRRVTTMTQAGGRHTVRRPSAAMTPKARSEAASRSETTPGVVPGPRGSATTIAAPPERADAGSTPAMRKDGLRRVLAAAGSPNATTRAARAANGATTADSSRVTPSPATMTGEPPGAAPRVLQEPRLGVEGTVSSAGRDRALSAGPARGAVSSAGSGRAPGLGTVDRGAVSSAVTMPVGGAGPPNAADGRRTSRGRGEILGRRYRRM